MSTISLLSLPRELRDMILSQVLQDERTSMSLLPAAHQMEGMVLLDPPDIWATRNTILVEESVAFQNAVAFVNRQLREECAAITKSVDYRIDMTLFKETTLVLRWLSLPCSTCKVSRLTCAVRTEGAGIDLDRRSPRYSGFRIGDGAPPALVWPLMGILRSFLERGPRWGVSAVGVVQTPFLVGNLIFELTTSDTRKSGPLRSPSSLLSARHLFETMDAKNPTQVDPDYFLKFIIDKLEGLIHMGNYTATRGDFLYARVGSITFIKDNSVVRHMDLNEELLSLGGQYPCLNYTRGLYEAAFKMWRPLVIRERIRCGFMERSQATEFILSTTHEGEYLSFEACLKACGG